MECHVQFEGVWKHLEPQIIEFFDDLHFKGYTDDEILTALSDPIYWVTNETVKKEVFNYEAANFTLLQLCNTVELLTGSDQRFVEELRQHMCSLLNQSVTEGMNAPCLISPHLSVALPAIRSYVIHRLA